MAVNQLTTAVDNLITRVVALQPLSIAQVTAGTVSDKMWYWNSPSAPFWGNRSGGLRHINRGDEWELTIVSRLWLATFAASQVGSPSPQELSWQYIPETLTYFQAIRTSLAPTGFAEIDYIGRQGITITCQRGEDFGINPGANRDDVFIEFIMIVPFMLVAL